MFHLREGFYFERTPDGQIRIGVAESAHADAPIIREVTVPENEWASVVATTSARGETAETYGEALTLLEWPHHAQPPGVQP